MRSPNIFFASDEDEDFPENPALLMTSLKMIYKITNVNNKIKSNNARTYNLWSDIYNYREKPSKKANLNGICWKTVK